MAGSVAFDVPEPTPRTRAFEAAYQRTPRETVLGRGAFGVAFAVQPRGDPGRRYVAKEIPVGRLSEKNRHEAMKESQLLQTLRHQNVVTCIDTFLTGSCLYIVMECASNGDLAGHIRAQRELGEHFAEEAVMRVFVQLCAALQYIHASKIMHRDLKPANIFVFGAGGLLASVVKLGDFGLGKMCEGTTFEAYSTVGSPSYFSPEICRSRPYGRKSDVWSLGVVLYELACLVVPFLAKVVPAVALMICKSEPQPLPEQYTAGLGSLVAALLQKDPRKRPSATEILSEQYVQQFAPAPADPGRGAGQDSGCPAQPAGASPCAQDIPALASTLSTVASTSADGAGSELACTENIGDSLRSAGTLRSELAATIRIDEEGGGCPQCSGMERVLETFRRCGAGQRGDIPREHLIEVFGSVAPHLTREAVDRVLTVFAGADGDVINYADFIGWLYR